ncbi:MAG: SecDF P1 head subdomain-containing protein [Frankiaceae bacterium]
MPVGSLDGIDYYVYWSHGQLCMAHRAASGAGDEATDNAGCSAVEQLGRKNALSAGPYEGEIPAEARIALAAVRDDVASATVEGDHGAQLRARFVEGRGFPERVAVVLDRRIHYGVWHAYGAAGQPLVTSEPFVLYIRQVLAIRPPVNGICRARSNEEIYRGADGSSCYVVAWPPIDVWRTVSATAVHDVRVGQWFVSVELTPPDARRYADLTRQVAGKAPPRDQLALIYDDEVLSAPAVQQQIKGGMLALSGTSMTEQRAREIAVEMSGSHG